MNTIKVDFDNIGFNLKEFINEKGETYIIEGDCSQCGKCCGSPLLSVGFNDSKGCCSKLISETVDGNPVHRCSIYTNRPIGCVLWPREPQDLIDIPECTYKITKI